MEKKKSFDIKVWLKIIKNIPKIKIRLVTLVIVLIFCGGFDSVLPQIIRHVIDNFAVEKTSEGLLLVGFIYLFVIICQSLLAWQLIMIGGRIETSIFYETRKIAFNKLQYLDLSYYNNNSKGKTIAKLTSDITKTGRSVAWSLVDIIWGSALLIFSIFSMFMMTYKITLLVLIFIPILIGVSLLFQKIIVVAFRKSRKINSDITSNFSETISASKVAKVLRAEDRLTHEFNRRTKSMELATFKAKKFSAMYLPVVTLVMGVMIALVSGVSGIRVLNETITPGVFMAFISYMSLIIMPIREISRAIGDILSSQASCERVVNLLEEEPQIIDNDEVVKKYGDILYPKKECWPNIVGKVEFESVNFTYKNGQKVLNNFSLKVNKGEMIALVGETGSGKTTIVNLLCRFLEPSSGKIKIDGVDIKNYPQNFVQSNVGYVIQNTALFSKTIKENILYANHNISENKLQEILKIVHLDEYIKVFENGIDTMVEEEGSNISLGQKQLISIARAVIKDPQILILDEATASIDTKTERLLQKSLNQVLKGRTSFVIAHRLSTIVKADRILVIEKGEIIESGSHKELIKKGGAYQKLYERDFSDAG